MGCKIKTSKKVGMEIASKEFVQDGPKKRAYDIMIDSVWKIATTKNTGKFIGLMHEVWSAPVMHEVWSAPVISDCL